MTFAGGRFRQALGRAGVVRGLREDGPIAVAIPLKGDSLAVRRPAMNASFPSSLPNAIRVPSGETRGVEYGPAGIPIDVTAPCRSTMPSVTGGTSRPTPPAT